MTGTQRLLVKGMRMNETLVCHGEAGGLDRNDMQLWCIHVSS